MDNQHAYEMSNSELMQKFWQALATAAVSGSGLVTDASGGLFDREARYYRGVILSRLDGHKPPVVRGEFVELSPDTKNPVASINTVECSYGHAEPGVKYAVVRTFYEGDGKWSFFLKDVDDYRFPANRFAKVEQKVTAEE